MTAHGEEVTWEPEARPAPDVAVQSAALEMCDRVRLVLPAQQFKILRLHHGEGYSLREIAGSMKLTRHAFNNSSPRPSGASARREFPEWMGA